MPNATGSYEKLAINGIEFSLLELVGNILIMSETDAHHQWMGFQSMHAEQHCLNLY